MTVNVMVRRQARTPGSPVQDPFPRARSLPRVPGSAPTTWKRKTQRGPRSRRGSSTARLLLPGAGGEHLPPGVTGTDGPGARMWPGGGGGLDPGKADRRSREARGQRGRPGSRALVAPPSRTVQLSPPGPAALPTSAPRRPLTRSAAPDSAAGSPRGGEPGAERITATTERRQRARATGCPEAALLPGSHTARRPRPRCVTPRRERARRGAGPAPGGLASRAELSCVRQRERVVSRKWPAPWLRYHQSCSGCQGDTWCLRHCGLSFLGASKDDGK